jgi:hypothetical protein
MPNLTTLEIFAHCPLLLNSPIRWVKATFHGVLPGFFLDYLFTWIKGSNTYGID